MTPLQTAEIRDAILTQLAPISHYGGRSIHHPQLSRQSLTEQCIRDGYNVGSSDVLEVCRAMVRDGLLERVRNMHYRRVK